MIGQENHQPRPEHVARRPLIIGRVGIDTKVPMIYQVEHLSPRAIKCSVGVIENRIRTGIYPGMTAQMPSRIVPKSKLKSVRIWPAGAFNHGPARKGS